MRQKIIFGVSLLAVVLAVLLSCGCARSKAVEGSQVPTVSVSVPVEEYFVRAIGGDRVRVNTLAPQSADPETFEPTISQLRGLVSSRAWLQMGTLPFEKAQLQNVASAHPQLMVADLSQGIDLMYGTHEHCQNHHHGDADHEHHGVADPHIWSSIKNAKIIARNTLNALVKAMPDKEPYFTSRYRQFAHRLDSLDVDAARRLASAGSREFTIWHPSLSYFARDYGLRQLPIGSEGKEMSVKALRQKLQQASMERSDTLRRVFFLQQELDPRQAQSLNQTIGAEIVEISPLSAQWEEEIEKIVSALQ